MQISLKNPLSCQLGIYMKSCGRAVKVTFFSRFWRCWFISTSLAGHFEWASARIYVEKISIFFFCGFDCVVSRPLNFVESDYSKVVLMSPFLLYISSKADILCICNRNIVSCWASIQQLGAQTTKKHLGQPKRNQLKIFLRPRRQFPKKAKQISSGNRTEWSLIRSVMWVINKIARLRSGSTICWLREWLQTESEDKKWKQKF